MMLRTTVQESSVTAPSAANSTSSATQEEARTLERRSIVKRLMATAQLLAAFCARERRWTVCMTAFVLVCTIELFTVQALTLTYSNDTGVRFIFWAPKIRLGLDLLFIATLGFAVRRRSQYVVAAGAFFIYLGLITYYQYFLRPLSLVTIATSWREGLQVGGFGLDLFPKGAMGVLLLVFAVKCTLLYFSRKASLPRSCAWLGACAAAAMYVSISAVANHFDPLDAIQTTRGVGRLGEIRGYLGPWFAEWYYLYRNNDQILAEAIERRDVVDDRLTPLEARIPVRKHLVILQAESLDFNIIGYRVKGKEVTPFLNRLREASMFYRVGAMHFTGSADADFAALNDVSGSRRMITYKIRGYPYQNTTPQRLANCGYDTYSFHGKSGEFYNRRPAFEKMGFKDIIFQEEMENRFGLKADRWGVRDADVLALSARMLRAAKTPTCHFIITLTTHTPYNLLSRSEREIFKDPHGMAENYINNMRYLDNCLRDYVTSLGSGTTVLIYADHPTEEGSEFAADREGAREFIPCLIYDYDQDLSAMQKTRGDLVSKDGSLNLVDVVNYLLAQVHRNCEATTTPFLGTPRPVPDIDGQAD